LDGGGDSAAGASAVTLAGSPGVVRPSSLEASALILGDSTRQRRSDGACWEGAGVFDQPGGTSFNRLRLGVATVSPGSVGYALRNMAAAEAKYRRTPA